MVGLARREFLRAASKKSMMLHSVKNLENIPDPRSDFRAEIEAREALIGKKAPQGKAFRLNSRQKILLCAELIATNKSGVALAKLHGISPAAVCYYARALSKPGSATKCRRRLTLREMIFIACGAEISQQARISQRVRRSFLKKLATTPPPILYRADGVTPFFFE